MPTTTIKYLAERFGQIGGKEMLPSYELARKAQVNWAVIEKNPSAEHALYHKLWDMVTQILNRGSYLQIHADVLNALEAELAGRTLTIRMSLGWIERSATGPTDFPALEEFIN